MIVNKESAVPNSLSIPSLASFMARVRVKEEILEADIFAMKMGLPLLVIGAGTNIVPRDYIKAVVVILDFKDIGIRENRLKIQAGKKWDNVVKFAVDNDLTGIEALSAIPGTAGAAPVQNIGAYGIEVSDYIENVEAYDRDKNEFVIIGKNDCQFEYRNSLFKKHPGRFIIASINLKLSKRKPAIPKYRDIEDYFREKDNDSPDSKQIREVVLNIRTCKLPNYENIPNAGSYFVNPVLEERQALAIKNKFPEIPIFPFKNKIKIPAGWLIEKVGLRGAKIGKVEISPLNALIITNPNRANFKEIEHAENTIRQKVLERFGINLERELVIV